MKLVVDTGPLLAFTDRRERAYGVVTGVLRDPSVRIMIPDTVLTEVDHMLRRVSVAAGRAFLEDVRQNGWRVPMDGWLFERALTYDRHFADLDLGLADGSIMAVAERERAQILTFDFADFRATRPLRGGFWRLPLQEADLAALS